jgi:hypothetical protein
MDVQKTLLKFDKYLVTKNVTFEAVIIGGAALNIMGVISRNTVDVDCLDPKIPEEIIHLSKEFRNSFPELGLIEKWINNGPDSLVNDLPTGWRNGLISIFQGKAIHLHTLSRIDLLKTKLFAYCDRDQNFQDCLALALGLDELNSCFDWVSKRDGHPL